MKVGDRVTRMLAGYCEMPLIITAIDDKFIHCGDWKFDKSTGTEVDEELGWGNERTGSYLKELWSGLMPSIDAQLRHDRAIQEQGLEMDLTERDRPKDCPR